MSSRGIIFIRDVFLKDCKIIDDVFEKEILKGVEIEEVTAEFPQQFDKRPQYFTGITTWLKTTNIRCFNCMNQFTNVPLFTTDNIEIDASLEAGMRLGVESIICDESCGVSFLRKKYGDDIILSEKFKMFKIAIKEVTSRIVRDGFYYAPDIYTQTMFGGDTTPEEYKKKKRRNNKNHKKIVRTIKR